MKNKTWSVLAILTTIREISVTAFGFNPRLWFSIDTSFGGVEIDLIRFVFSILVVVICIKFIRNTK